jgi:hypothetical protein
MTISVLARVRRGLSERRPGRHAAAAGTVAYSPATQSPRHPNEDGNIPFQTEGFDDDLPHIGNSVPGNFPPPPRSTAAEVLVVEALLDGFIRY